MSPFKLSCQWARSRGISYESYESLESTNLEASRKALTDPGLKLYFANFQTQGRGRNKRVWVSPKKDTALLVSFSFLFKKQASHLLPLFSGLHLCKTVYQFFPYENIKLKLPNDLYCDEKKIGGLLIERKKNRLIFGLGLNVFSSPKELAFAGHLEEGLKKIYLSFTKQLWFSFLDELLKWPLERRLLSLKSREALKKIVKPSFDTPLLDITASGDLVFKDRKIFWHKL